MSPLFSLHLQLLPVTPCEMKILAVLLLLWMIIFFLLWKETRRTGLEEVLSFAREAAAAVKGVVFWLILIFTTSG